MLQLNVEEKTQILGLTIAGAAGLYLLGNYGVEGDFVNPSEHVPYAFAGILGGGSLLLTAVGEGILIRREIVRDQEASRARGDVEDGAVVASAVVSEEDDSHVKELSSVWIGLAVMATTIVSSEKWRLLLALFLIS